MKIPFAQIDAFANAPFSGNAAAVMPLDAWLDDATLQAIASENNLSETAFLVPDARGSGDFELRWHTPESEVALCGHATLASGHYILSRDPERRQVTFRTREAGLLSVARADDGYALTLPAWTPSPAPLPDIVAALKVNATETLWHEKGYALIVLEDEAAVCAAAPDMTALTALGPIVAVISAPGDATDIVSRVFTPYFQVPEDPATGSAHALAVPYWAERLGKDSMTAFQASKRGARIGCTLAGDRVILTGNCVTVIEGVFTL